jgi:predicted XRE-type DNA-binding protein
VIQTIKQLKKEQQMKLKEWIKKNKLSCSEAAHKFGIFNINPAVNVHRYANGQRIPRKEEMKKIYIGTDKEVQPNDFYDFI